MRQCSAILLSAVVSLFATSCIRSSMVVEVKKDGSGSILSRYYFSPQMLALIDQLGALPQLEGAGQQGPDLGMIKQLAKPDKESLEADEKNLGEGVRYVKHEAGKDADGWEGYVVTYEFDDISKVHINQKSVPGKAKELAESAGEDLEATKGGQVTFSKEGDVLTIHTTLAEGSMDELVDQDQLDQANQMGMKPSQAIQMAAGMSDGMRVGMFVRIDGGIAETNAEHVTGNLIILTEADVTKVLSDPDFAQFVDRVADDPDGIEDGEIQELFGKLEAMTLETSDTVTVRFQ